MDYWGYHLICDAADCSQCAITDYDTIYNFAKKLVKEIDMVAFGEPQIILFGSGNKAGYTLIQLIETSNICVHFVPDAGIDDNGNKHNAMYMDTFSCKPYNKDTVIKLIKEFFAPKSIRETYLTRQA